MSDVPAVRLRGIRKRFGETLAVDGVELELRSGEIHALLGENGAGKSTLMCLLAGLYRPDAGTLELEGRRIEGGFRTPRAAMALGIGMVHQHFMLVPTLTVAENVLLGAARIPWLLRRRRIEREVQATADRLGLRVSAGALCGDLSVGEQQRVEILRVLARGARVMILDEPTAVLAPTEVEALFASLRRLASEGTALVLISHKLEELRQLADRLTVMRRGRVVARFEEPAAASADELAAAMVGREVSLEIERGAPAAGPAVLLAARGIRVRDRRGLEAVRGLDLEVRGGEIVGLCGVSGNGQRELFEAIAGLRPLAGELRLCGEEVSGASARRRAELGLRYIPEDRQRTGSAPALSVLENLGLRRYREPPARSGPWLRLSRLAPFCREKIEELQIAASSLEQQVRLLSGGNLQKLILARELDAGVGGEGARVILAMHPTRGLDAWATAQARRLLLAARDRGAAVLLCSEELEEVLALSDRVHVIAGGRLVHRVASEEERADRLAIARAMASGGASGPEVPS